MFRLSRESAQRNGKVYQKRELIDLFLEEIRTFVDDPAQAR
jgi:hypothetical protein